MDVFGAIIQIVLHIVEKTKSNPFKTIITLLIITTIILIKPLVYYSTLFLEIYKSLFIWLIGIFLFGVVHFIIKTKKKIDYDQDTLIIISLFPIIIIVENIVLLVKYDSIMKLVYHNDIDTFINNIHYMEYNKQFFQYVSSNFITILSFAIEFLNVLMIVYLIFYIIVQLISNLNDGISTIKEGLMLEQKKKILTLTFLIIITSPCMFFLLIPFLTNIF